MTIISYYTIFSIVYTMIITDGIFKSTRYNTVGTLQFLFVIYIIIVEVERH